MSASEHLVVLENSLLRVEILPALGGKIASIQVKRNRLELLQQPLRPYHPRTLQQSFEDSDASGSDECLPTIAACAIDWNGQRRNLPDHGDVWRLPCDATISENTIAIKVNLFSLPLCLEREIDLRDNSLHIRYRISNIGTLPVPFLWSAHSLFAVDAGDSIVLPRDISEMMVESSSGNRLGPAGSRISWPHTISTHDHPLDLSRVLDPKAAVGDKLFASFADQPPDTSTWCGLYREQHQTGISIAFPTLLLRSLGLWLCYGGWPQGASHRQQCVAFEPSTCPTDSLERSIETGNAQVLSMGDSASWTIDWFVHGAAQPITRQRFEHAAEHFLLSAP